MTRLRVTIAAIFGITTALSMTSGVLGADPEIKQVEDAAIQYARAFARSITDTPEEVGRLGMTSSALMVSVPVAAHRVLALDAEFGRDGDRRALDAALIASPLWLVVLQAGEEQSVVVSVDWEVGAPGPRPAGLNWIRADDLTKAFAHYSDGSGRVVWPRGDHPVVLGAVDAGALEVVPIIDELSARELGLDVRPMPVAEYTDRLRTRMNAARTVSDSRNAGGIAAQDQNAEASENSHGRLLVLGVIAVLGGVIAFSWSRRRTASQVDGW